MSKPTSHFVCQSCGATYAKWAGKCDSCGQWNCLVEEALPTTPAKSVGSKGGRQLDFTSLQGKVELPARYLSNIQELDRVCGGGFVQGSVILVGGDPGIGKSTLLLQAVAQLSSGKDPLRCVYISGEESVAQIQRRAKRLGLEGSSVELASAMNVRDILASLDTASAPDVVVIDSIQTMFVDTLDSAPGTVGQVRAAGHELIEMAKRRNCVLFLVGHVTKEGALAGPRVLEHMVDTVLYFEGDRGHHFRILRAVKNRFGATDEIGVFEMTEQGLKQVPNPSALFLAERQGNISGSCVFAGVEGSRPMLVEIQALVAPAGNGMGRRAVVGWDANRLNMLVAVLEARCGLSLGSRDIYLNVAGGLKVTEPAADLAVAAALISALTQKPMPADAVVFGEVGLSGEVRSVPLQDLRLKESKKLGFSRAFMPKATHKTMNICAIGHIRTLVDLFMKGTRE